MSHERGAPRPRPLPAPDGARAPRPRRRRRLGRRDARPPRRGPPAGDGGPRAGRRPGRRPALEPRGGVPRRAAGRASSSGPASGRPTPRGSGAASRGSPASCSAPPREFPLRSSTASVPVTVRGVSADAPRFLALQAQRGPLPDAGGGGGRSEGRRPVGRPRRRPLRRRGGALGREVLIGGQRFEVVGVLVPVEGRPGQRGGGLLRSFPRRDGAARDSARQGRPPPRGGLARPRAALEAASRRSSPRLQRGVEPRVLRGRVVPRGHRGTSRRRPGPRRPSSAASPLFSLLVAASGILNTLLVGVKERTREIGTRRALGARRRTILAQFLLESVLLSLPGAALGLGAGVAPDAGARTAVSKSVSQPILVDLAVGPAEALVAVVLSAPRRPRRRPLARLAGGPRRARRSPPLRMTGSPWGQVLISLELAGLPGPLWRKADEAPGLHASLLPISSSEYPSTT